MAEAESRTAEEAIKAKQAELQQIEEEQLRKVLRPSQAIIHDTVRLVPLLPDGLRGCRVIGASELQGTWMQGMWLLTHPIQC